MWSYIDLLGYCLKIERTNPQNQSLHLANCTARLKQPFCKYQRRSVGDCTEDRPREVLSLHQDGVNTLNPFQGLTKNMVGDKEWNFITQLEAIVINDNPEQPIVYALIPQTTVEAMDVVEFHGLMESLANNEQIKNQIKKSCGLKDCGLVFFMIDPHNYDENDIKQSSKPIGVDYEKFKWEHGRQKLILLGATGGNKITPKDIEEFAHSSVERYKVVLASDLRRVVSDGRVQFIHTIGKPFTINHPVERHNFRNSLNGRGIEEDVEDRRFRLGTKLEMQEVAYPQQDQSPIAILPSNTTPPVVEQARYYAFDPNEMNFVDTREEVGYDPDTDEDKRLWREQIMERIPFPLRGPLAHERRRQPVS